MKQHDSLRIKAQLKGLSLTYWTILDDIWWYYFRMWWFLSWKIDLEAYSLWRYVHGWCKDKIQDVLWGGHHLRFRNNIGLASERTIRRRVQRRGRKVLSWAGRQFGSNLDREPISKTRYTNHFGDLLSKDRRSQSFSSWKKTRPSSRWVNLSIHVYISAFISKNSHLNAII